ncbi:TPA: hypothetical protein HA238_00575 [Candidatus Micrarchaeota archaeon]|nr:hypothetical protein [Candidatus Micrarchaeota archaeon]
MVQKQVRAKGVNYVRSKAAFTLAALAAAVALKCGPEPGYGLGSKADANNGGAGTDTVEDATPLPREAKICGPGQELKICSYVEKHFEVGEVLNLSDIHIRFDGFEGGVRVFSIATPTCSQWKKYGFSIGHKFGIAIMDPEDPARILYGYILFVSYPVDSEVWIMRIKKHPVLYFNEGSAAYDHCPENSP